MMPISCIKKSVFIFMSLLFSLVAHGICAELQKAADFKPKWLHYDGNEQLYVPYFQDFHGKVNSFYLIVQKSDLEGKQLTFTAETPTYFYLQEKLLAFAQPGDTAKVKFDNFQAYRLLQGKALLMFYSSSEVKDPPKIQLTDVALEGGGLLSKQKEQVVGNSFQMVWGKKTETSLVVFALATLFIFSFFMGKGSPIIGFFELDTYIKNLLRGIYEDQQLNAVQLLATITYYALSLAFFIMLISWYSTKSIGMGSLWFGDDFFLLVVLGIALLTFAYILLRLLIINLLVKLYGFNNVGDQHVYEYLKLSQAYGTILFLFGILFLIWGNVQYYPWFLNLMAFIFLGKSVMVAIKMNKLLPLKKIYLISYFCTAEFIPTIVALKYFMG